MTRDKRKITYPMMLFSTHNLHFTNLMSCILIQCFSNVGKSTMLLFVLYFAAIFIVASTRIEKKEAASPTNFRDE